MKKQILSTIALLTVVTGAMAQYAGCPDDNHPHMIDLGLSSGTRWACCNVGATTPERLGSKFAWGETEEKFVYDWSSYVHCDGIVDTCHDLGESICGSQYDVAHVKWGSEWRLPTISQVRELINTCDYEWTIVNEVYGGKFTGPNGNSIFIPSPGDHYSISLFSGTQSTDSPNEAFSLHVQSNWAAWGNTSRSWGTYIRPAFYYPSFEKDGLYYNVHIDGKTLEVAKPRNPSDYSGDIVIPENVEHEGKTYIVTAIESRAFYKNMELTSLKIPKTMRTIGEDTFWDCDSLKTVDIGSISNWCTIDFQGNLWFSNPISRYELEHLLVNGEEITDLVIPDDVKEISRNAFYWCPPIRSLEIPGTVKTIGEDAFYRCYNLRKVILHEGIEHIGKGGLANMRTPTITVPKSVTQMDKNALNYENTESWLRNVCLLNPDPDAVLLTDWPGLESPMISVPAGAANAYKNHYYWGQFTIVEGLDEDDFSKGVVRVDYFYADEPLVKMGSAGWYAPSLKVFPGCQNDGTLTCDFALGFYKNDQLMATTNHFRTGWTFADWKTCRFSCSTGIIIDNIPEGSYQMRLLYKIGEEDWKPAVNSEKVYIDITVKDEQMTLRNRYLDGAKLHLDSFAVNGMPKIGHDMTASVTITNEGMKRDGCLFLLMNDTVRGVVQPVLKPGESTEMTFEEQAYTYVFKPQSPGTYKFDVVNGEGEVLSHREISIPAAERNHLELVNLNVENLFGEFVVSKENHSINVEVKNDGDTPYNDELKFVTRMIWGFYQEGDTLISYMGSVYRPLVVQPGESGSCHYEYIDYDYYDKIGLSPYPPYNSMYSVEVYYYSEGKEVLLAKTPYLTWINPEEYEGKILIKPVGFTREYGDENPKLEYSIYGGTLNGEPRIYTEASADSPAKHYEIKCEKGSVTNENVVYGTGVMKVTKAPLTITAKSYTREQGEENPPFELSYSGFKNGETLAVLTKLPSVATTATADSEPGDYDVVVSGAEAQNYDITYVNGKLTVTVPSGISEVINGDVFDVYTTSGRMVKKNSMTLKGLAKGVYIVNRRKVIVK